LRLATYAARTVKVAGGLSGSTATSQVGGNPEIAPRSSRQNYRFEDVQQ
jgi:hypothetical protein